MPITETLLQQVRGNDPRLIVIEELKDQILSIKDLQNLQSALQFNTVVGRIIWGKTQEQHDAKLLKAIENRLSENNHNYRDRPSDYEYAMLSEHVYQDSKPGSLVEWVREDKQVMSLSNWRVEDIFLDEKNGYYGVAYYNPLHHFLVLAHRGIEATLYSLFLKDAAKDLTADISITYNHITAQQISAYAAAEKFIKLAKDKHWRFSTTGHSLGGWLAQITLIHCHMDFSYPEAHAVTFDNPGAKSMLKKLDEGSATDFRLSLQDLDITTYLSAPNVVNTCHSQLGALYRLFPQQVDIRLDRLADFAKRYYLPEWVADKLVKKLQDVEIVQWFQTVRGHSMAGIVDCFEPTTGAPRRVERVLKWPQVIWYQEDHVLQDWIRQRGKEAHIPQQLGDWANQATQWAIQWLGLGMGGLPAAAAWVASYFTKQVADDVVKKALRYTADLQIIHTAELVLNYYHGNADKSIYQTFLKFADATNDFHPSASTLPLKDRYTLHFEANYKTEPSMERHLRMRQFRSDEVRQFLRHCDPLCALMSLLPEFSSDKTLTNLLATYRLNERHVVEITDTQLSVLEFRRLTTRYIERFHELKDFGKLLQRILMQPASSNKLTKQQQQAMQGELTYTQLNFDILLEQLTRRYEQQDYLLDLFAERDRSISNSYINLAMVKEADVRQQEQHLSEEGDKRSKEGTDFESLLRISSRDAIYAAPEKLELANLFQQHVGNSQRILVLGEPGVGKTTFCQYVAYQWAQGELWNEHYDWVFWIQLRHLNRYEKHPTTYNWVDVIAKELFDRTLTGEENQQLKHFLQDALTQNKILFLLDGYDEIASHHADSQWPLKAAIDELLQMGHYLLTSRPHAVAGLRQATDLAVQITGFTPDNIAVYINDFFLTQPEKAQRLQAFLGQHPAVQGIARVPINLQLVCLSWREGEAQDIPTLTELYDAMLIALLRRELQKKGIDARHYLRSQILKNFSLELNALSALAFYGLREGQVIILPEVIDQLLNRYASQRESRVLLKDLQQLGLLKPVDANSQHSDYYFIHKTFQEFFAGYYVAKLFETKNPAAKILLTNYKYSPALEVVWWFAAGLLSINKLDIQPMNAFFTALIYEEPIDIFGLYSRRLVIRCLDETRVSEKIRGVSNYLEWITNAISLKNKEILLFLIEQLSHSPFVKRRCSKILNLLLKAIKDSKGVIRSSAAEALGKLGQATPAVIETLLQALNDSEVNVRFSAAEALGQLRQATPAIIEALLQASNDSEMDVRLSAGEALWKLGQTTRAILEAAANEAYLKFVKASSKEDGPLQRIARKIVMPSLTKDFLQTLRDSSEKDARRGAAFWFGRLGRQAVTPAVIDTLFKIFSEARKDSDWDTLFIMAEALGQLGQTTPAVIEALFETLKDSEASSEYRSMAADTLGKLAQAKPAALEALLQALGNSQGFWSWTSRLIKNIQVAQEVVAQEPDVFKQGAAMEARVQVMKDSELIGQVLAAQALTKLGQATPAVLGAFLIKMPKLQREVVLQLIWQKREATLLPYIIYQKNQALYTYGVYGIEPQKIDFTPDDLPLLKQFFDYSTKELPEILGFHSTPPMIVEIGENDHLDSFHVVNDATEEALWEERSILSHQRKLLSIDLSEDELLSTPLQSSGAYHTATIFPPIISLIQIVSTTTKWLTAQPPRLLADSAASSRPKSAAPLFYDGTEWLIAPDPLTGEPVFQQKFTYRGEEVASATLYGQPVFCSSLNGKQHNVLDITGYFANIKLAPSEEVCRVLPPTVPQVALDSALQGARMGAMRGMANTIGGKNSWQATGLFYGSYYLWRVYEVSQAKPEQDSLSTLYQAGSETLWLAATEIALTKTSHVLQTAGNHLQQMQQASCRLVGKITNKTASMVGYSCYAYEAVNAWRTSPTSWRTAGQFAVRTVSSISSGYLAQQATEKIGAVTGHVIRFFKAAKQTTTSMPVVKTTSSDESIRGWVKRFVQ